MDTVYANKNDKYISYMDLCMEYIISVLTSNNAKKYSLYDKMSNIFILSTTKYKKSKDNTVALENLNKNYLINNHSYDKNFYRSIDYLYFVIKDNKKYCITIDGIDINAAHNVSMINLTLYGNNKYKYRLSKNLEGKIRCFGSYLNYYTVYNDELHQICYDKNDGACKKKNSYKVNDKDINNIILTDISTGLEYTIINYKLYSTYRLKQKMSSLLYWNIIMLSDEYLSIKK